MAQESRVASKNLQIYLELVLTPPGRLPDFEVLEHFVLATRSQTPQQTAADGPQEHPCQGDKPGASKAKCSEILSDRDRNGVIFCLCRPPGVLCFLVLFLFFARSANFFWCFFFAGP